MLGAAVKGQSERARGGALSTFARMDTVTPDVEAILYQALRDGREGRGDAARALQHIPPARIAAAVPVLVSALADADREVRVAAADTLGSFGTQASSASRAAADIRQEAATGLGGYAA